MRKMYIIKIALCIAIVIFVYPRLSRLLGALLEEQPPSNSEVIEVNLLEEHDPNFLFFNRVPKTGSELVAKLLRNLALVNGFEHKRYGQPQPRLLGSKKEKNFVKKLLSFNRPISYDRLMGRHIPIWFSLVRNPVEKFISRFNYARRGKYHEGLDSNMNIIPDSINETDFRRKDIERCVIKGDVECTFKMGQKYDLTIPYFCGQHSDCMILGSEWALRRAVLNLERAYPVVGVLEDLQITLGVMDAMVPRFFKGIKSMYNLKEPHTNTNRRKKVPSKAAKEKLGANLTLEFDFYKYVQQRLHYQAKNLI